MNINWRIPSIGAAGSGILSFLIGGIFKVAFPLILIRALIFSVIAFGLIYLILFVISKYLSELLSDVSSDEEFSQNSSAFGIDQNGDPGVEYDEEAEPATEGVQGARLSGEDITIDVEGNDDIEMNQLGGVESETESQVGATTFSSVPSSPMGNGGDTEAFLNSNPDPEDLAKSIRTVLKRDEKGSG